ncbi:MAG TPA: 4-hydroxyphenylacetate 3-hydroxylase N-terminal domain-containing protein [Methylomirabilota bacterium]|jgi:4-hydroxyphenylacetate 3-monooxygenase|nr:4-hydroxyphenylacetate 3-hydroxylase N-terminal domain-containing protein [Methylomirabilota bacterium]
MDYVTSLRDGRAIFLDGARVDDVTTHSAFAESVRRIVERYDAAGKAEDVTTCVDPASGRRIGAMWLIPRSAEDLGRRRAVHRFWAEGSYGLMGRTPDHVASVLTAFAGWRHLFDRAGSRFGDNVVRFYEKARDEDLYVAYAIVPPQIDRATPAHQHREPFLHPGVVKETDAGIVIRGAHAIATSVTMADWLYVSYITPLAPGDVDYAISLVVPVHAEGLRLLPRRPYATLATSVFDYPLSARYDEVDTTVVFDDVFVPWEHVFVYKNVELVTAQFHESPAHTTANFQSLVRFGVKLEFLAGLVAKLVEVQGSANDPAIQAMLGGDVAAYCTAFDGLVKAAEHFPLISEGYARPHPQYIYAGMSLQRRLVVDLNRTMRELAGGAFQNVPSSELSFVSPETRADTERYYQSAASGARDRIKLLKLIWDFVGTEYGGRQLQYEMFYSAAQPVVNRRMFRAYDWRSANDMVDRLLGEY